MDTRNYNYIELANSIAFQAYLDGSATLQEVFQHNSNDNEEELTDIIKFIGSNWYKELCNIPERDFFIEMFCSGGALYDESVKLSARLKERLNHYRNMPLSNKRKDLII